jgi:hypothetical protein
MFCRFWASARKQQKVPAHKGDELKQQASSAHKQGWQCKAKVQGDAAQLEHATPTYHCMVDCTGWPMDSNNHFGGLLHPLNHAHQEPAHTHSSRYLPSAVPASAAAVLMACNAPSRAANREHQPSLSAGRVGTSTTLHSGRPMNCSSQRCGSRLRQVKAAAPITTHTPASRVLQLVRTMTVLICRQHWRLPLPWHSNR